MASFGPTSRERLEAGFSPEVIAGELRVQHGRCVISHEAIYRFVYHRSQQKDYWHRLLPRRKSRRGKLGQRGARSPMEHIQGRVSIHERPAEVDSRASAGHWEGDLMLFSRYGQAILITHERSSRLLLATRQPSKAAGPVAAQLLLQFEALPPQLRRTFTVDNGTEFAQPPPPYRRARDGHLLLRSAFSLAERRYRERDRSHASPVATQDRSGGAEHRHAKSPGRRLQSHAAKVLGFRNPRPGVLAAARSVALQP